MKQYSFAKTKTPIELPHFVELQKNSYDDFLQKDIDLKERKWVGIHGAFLDVFGIAGKSTIFVESLPEDIRAKRKSINLLAKITKKNIKDIERITNLLPSIVMDDVEDEEAKKIKTQLDEIGIKSRVVPQGISNNDGSLILQYNGYELLEPKYPAEDNKTINLKLIEPAHRFDYANESARLTGRSFESRLVVNFRLIKRKQTGEPTIIDEKVYLADIPLMTPTCSFIINGAERVIITQIHRSAGVIFEEDEDNDISQYGKKLYKAAIIPYRGSWLEFVFDNENLLYVMIDKRRKIYVTTFLRALGLTTEEIINIFCIKENIEISKLEAMLERQEKPYRLAQQIIDETTGEVIESFSELDKSLIEKIKNYKLLKYQLSQILIKTLL